MEEKKPICNRSGKWIEVEYCKVKWLSWLPDWMLRKYSLIYTERVFQLDEPIPAGELICFTYEIEM